MCEKHYICNESLLTKILVKKKNKHFPSPEEAVIKKFELIISTEISCYYIRCHDYIVFLIVFSRFITQS